MFGLINVTQTVAQARDLGTVLNTFFLQQGMGAYTSTRAAEIGGLLLALTSVTCLVLAIGFAVPRLRTRRRAFWIPIACAAVSLLVTTVVIAGAVTVDPAFPAYLESRT